MGCQPPAQELAHAFLDYAESCASADDQLLERIQRLEGRALALELVVKALVRDGAVGRNLRTTILHTLEREFSHCIGASSSYVEATAALVSTLLELLPESKPEQDKLRPEAAC
jgi:hypothetical protein